MEIVKNAKILRDLKNLVLAFFFLLLQKKFYALAQGRRSKVRSGYGIPMTDLCRKGLSYIY